MKIRSVEAIPLEVPIKEDLAAPISLPHAAELASTVFRAYRTTLVRIETDDGISGIGECMVRLAPLATAAIVDELESLLIGRDPRDTGFLWELLYGVMHNRGHQKGFYLEALSGIDIALCDIAGKAAGLPVYQLLGGAQRDQLDAYASSLRFRSMAQTTEKLDELRQRGFHAMKIKIGRDASDTRADLEFVSDIRDHVGPDVRLMVDANCGYDVATAVDVAHALEDLDIFWFEEPIAPDDFAGYRRLTDRTRLRIAAGETTFTRFGFRNLLEHGRVAIVQPNATRSGGISECMRISSLASAFGVRYAPHTGSSSAVCMAAALHLAAAVPNFLVYEFMVSDWSAQQPNPLRHDLVIEPAEVLDGDGTVRLPRGPGLGIELDMDVVDRWRVH